MIKEGLINTLPPLCEALSLVFIVFGQKLQDPDSASRFSWSIHQHVHIGENDGLGAERWREACDVTIVCPKPGLMNAQNWPVAL